VTCGDIKRSDDCGGISSFLPDGLKTFSNWRPAETKTAPRQSILSPLRTRKYFSFADFRIPFNPKSGIGLSSRCLYFPILTRSRDSSLVLREMFA
jgi:hypothetical protein